MPGYGVFPDQGAPGAGGLPVSRERRLILSALQQVEPPSTWTSRQVQSDSPSGTVSPDAPTAAESSFSSQPASPELPGPNAFPGYEIQREIHRGGQGVVYLANQINTKRRVAVKVMHGGATLGSTGRTRFEREVQLLGQLNHPNIVKLHDSGVTSDGSFFYVMDYVSGRALDDILREKRRDMRHESASTRSRSRSRTDGADSIETTLAFFAKICDGVNAAHLKGVIHRDIKPANVRVDQSGEPVLVDFGLAKVTAGVETDLDPSNPMTMTGQFIGSLPWASPEQAVGSGDAIDLRSDVYSLGVMLFQMLTGGRFPYTVIGNMRDVLDNIQRAEPSRPSTIRRQINDEVETIVLKALAKERERRYQSAGELARDIRRYLKGEPIEAKRDAGWYVIRKTLNRHKFAVTFAATVAVLITGSAVGMTGLWRQAEGARGIAVTERDRAEDNLEAVRDLANTFLYDFSDSVMNLRGATRAREAVLAKALEYLALLAAQPGSDPASLDALADAHERVGDLYGAIYAANTGTTRQAMTHYEAALEIRTRIADAAPLDMLFRSRLAGTWERIGEARSKQMDLDGSLAAYEEGMRLATMAGDTAVGLSIMTRAGDIHRRMAVDLANDPKAFVAKLATARSLYEQADAGWSALATPEAPRRRAVLLSKLGQGELLHAQVALVHWEDPQTARRHLDAGHQLVANAVQRFEQLSAASPADYTLARDLWVTMHHLGQSQYDAAGALAQLDEELLSTEMRARALDTFTRLHAYAASLATDQSNLEAQRDLVISQVKLGNTLRELGRLPEARAVLEESLQRVQAVYQTDPVERHLRDLCVGHYKVAEIDELLAAGASGPAERDAVLRLARSGYVNALNAVREYAERGGPGEMLTKAAQDAIARIDQALASE